MLYYIIRPDLSMAMFRRLLKNSLFTAAYADYWGITGYAIVRYINFRNNNNNNNNISFSQHPT